MQPLSKPIDVPMTPGETLDRLSILEVKVAKLRADPPKALMASRQHKELMSLCGHLFPVGGPAYEDLYAVNAALWDAEDTVRSASGAEWEDAARAVPTLNERRARIKQDFDRVVGCSSTEVKGYV